MNILKVAEVKMIDVCLLGCGGMMPLPDRFLTSLLCRHKGRMYVIDCGEATQVTMKMNGWGFKKIDLICFTHYHADHISGLPGLLLTIGNSGRTEPLHLVGPYGLKEVVTGLLVIARELPFKLIFHEMEEDVEEGEIYLEEITIEYFKVKHRVDCYGYNILLNRVGKFNVDKAQANNIPKNLWGVLQKNKTFEYMGNKYFQNQVLDEPRKGIKITYVTDTLPIEKIAEKAENTDLLVCEGMYGDDESKEKTHSKFHMVFSDAIDIAKKSKAKELWLTHFSPAFDDPFEYESFLKSEFSNGEIGFDRKQKVFNFEN